MLEFLQLSLDYRAYAHLDTTLDEQWTGPESHQNFLIENGASRAALPSTSSPGFEEESRAEDRRRHGPPSDNGDVSSSVEFERPYRKPKAAGNSVRSRTTGLLIACGVSWLLCAGKSDVLATALQVHVYIDTTASVNRPELVDLLPILAAQIEAGARAIDSTTFITLRAWSGTPLEGRSSGKPWVVSGVDFKCDSPFKLRCEYLYALAKKQSEAARAPVLAQFERAMQALADRLEAEAISNHGSCIASLLGDGDRAAINGLAIVATDGALEGCRQELVAARSRGRVIVIVLGCVSDGDDTEQRVQRRVDDLRALGFTAVNGVAGAQSLPWPALFARATR